MSLTPEIIRENLERIKAFYPRYNFEPITISAWLAAMKKMSAQPEELRDAIINHSLESKWPPAVHDIVVLIRKARDL